MPVLGLKLDDHFIYLLYFLGQTNAEDLPNGRGTILFAGGNRFEGRFCKGRNCFMTPC